MQAEIGEMVIVTGYCTRDAEYRVVGTKGTPLCTFGLAVGKRKDTTTIFANCQAWRKLAEYAAGIQKGDSVIVVGHIEKHEYNNKEYTNLVADWLNFVDMENAPANTPPSDDTGGQTSAFSEIDSRDGDLPF